MYIWILSKNPIINIFHIIFMNGKQTQRFHDINPDVVFHFCYKISHNHVHKNTMPWYNWNIAKLGVKYQSINQLYNYVV